jgi:hypothetical protein
MLRPALADVAAELERRAAEKANGFYGLGEMSDLRPAIVHALNQAYGEAVQGGPAPKVPNWLSVGNVDLRIAGSQVGALLLADELKWCQRDQMYESIWDLFKMALLATSDGVFAAYLIAGAPMSKWHDDPCRDLYESQSHDPLDLCGRRFPAGKRRLMWDDLLEGGYDRFPDAVPEAIRTDVVAAVPLCDGRAAWGLRVVRVSAAGAGVVRFSDGWPNGHRPADATRPVGKELPEETSTA